MFDNNKMEKKRKVVFNAAFSGCRTVGFRSSGVVLPASCVKRDHFDAKGVQARV